MAEDADNTTAELMSQAAGAAFQTPSPAPPHSYGIRSRTGVLIGVGLVLCVAAGVRHGPAPAGASPYPATDSRAKVAPPNEPEISETELQKLSDDLKQTGSRRVTPLTALKSNPFRSNTASSATFDAVDEVVQDEKQEQERQATLAAFQSLRLQSISDRDNTRSCVIDGVRYTEGQPVSGFVVEEIAASAVVVRKGIHRFELKIK